MGLRDALFGRTKQVQPKLDNLFALPTAALTLETELDLVTSGQAGLCFKSGSGESTITTDADLIQLLNFDESSGKVKLTTDDLGFKWLVDHGPRHRRLGHADPRRQLRAGGERPGTATALRGLRVRAQDATG